MRNTTVTSLDMENGGKITVGVLNIGTPYTITWPASIKFAGGGPPVQPKGLSGAAALGLYTFYKIATVIYGVLTTTAAPAPTTIAKDGRTPPLFPYGEPLHGGKVPTQIP